MTNPKTQKEEEGRHFTHGSSGSTADMAVEGQVQREDRVIHRPDAPHARNAEPLKQGKKHDQLADKQQSAENRQEALLDEGIEESFPGSDPVSVKRIT